MSVTAAQVGEQLFEIAPDALVIVDSEGVIRMVNSRAEALFGYSRPELEGQSVEILVPEPTRAVHPDHRRSYVTNPRARPMGAGLRLTARRKDGSEFPVDIALSTLATPNGLFVVAAVRDVSEQWAWAERARLQAQLHQAQRLESIGQLAGGIAHDFNNLLAVILNYAGFVAEALRESPARSDEVLHDVEQIMAAAERAAALTHQLLIFSRREVIKPKVLDLNQVVGDLSKLLQRTIGEHVTLHTTLGQPMWQVTADPSQIEQVLVNLAVNARDAMPEGGRLEISTDTLELDPESSHFNVDAGPGRWVRLTVSDTGSGMDAATLERAFEPFFTTKPRGQGSGLGLATVYGIVAQAGGDIRLYSEPGLGTTVKIYLPANENDEQASAAAPETQLAVPGRGETVLVAEDEEAVREMTRRILVKNGYRVLAASSGVDALRLARDPNQTIDLLLTDVVMPGMSGKDLSRSLSELRPNVKTLFMSGYGQDVIVHRGVVEKGVRLLEKPFSARALLARVKEALAEDGQ